MSDLPNARVEDLEARVSRLESEVERLRSGGAAVLPPPPPRPGSPPPPSPDARVYPPPNVAAASESRPDLGLVINSESALKWGGVALVVLAVGFTVSTAISRGWIGPEIQLAGAVAFSLALIGVGLRVRATRMPWTHALCSGGIAALYTTFASDLFVDQVNTDTALVATVVVGTGGYVLSRFTRSEWVGVVTLVGAVVAWPVIARDDLPFGPTLGWFFFVVAVAVALSLWQRWFGLRLLGQSLGLVLLLTLAGEAEGGIEQIGVIVAGAAIYASLLRIPSIGGLDEPWQEIEIQLAAVAGPWAFALVSVVFDLNNDAEVGFVALAAAALTVSAAISLEPRIRSAHFVSLLLGASVSLTIGLATLLGTETAFIAVAVQGAGLVVLSRSLGGSIRVLVNAAALLSIAAVFVLAQGIAAWSDDASAGDDLAHLAIIVVLLIGLWQTRHRPTEKLGAAAVLGLVLVWLGSVLVHLPEGQAAVSVSWAVVGIALLVGGAMRKVPDVGAAGLTVLGLTVGKLLIVDMQEVDTLWRAGLFFVVGLGILRLGFLLPRLTGATDERPDSE